MPVAEFLVRNHTALLEELQTEAPNRYPFIQYNDTLRTAQGAYLTRCTTKLYDLIRNEVYLEEESDGFDAATRAWRPRLRNEFSKSYSSLQEVNRYFMQSWNS
jgi:hypothetical protein